MKYHATILIVGAGFTGAVIARELALAGYRVHLIDEHTYLGGICYTRRDEQSGIMVHAYGPHIFHTDKLHVWEYLSQFCTFMPYQNRVKAISGGRVYSLPINLLTINQFFGKILSPEEARVFIAKLGDSSITEPRNFEEQALKMLGERLYWAFFYGYTKKQWGREPTAIPASILKRLPVRFNYDDNYYNDSLQGIPKEGYTAAIENIVDVDGIELSLNTQFADVTESYHHTFYSGAIDRYFDHHFGNLSYRTLRFEEIRARGDYQGTAVMNYCDLDVPYTRITEHKYFTPWELDRFDSTICFREYSGECGPEDTPLYPVNSSENKRMLQRYRDVAQGLEGLSFVGRMGTYRYIDMDVAIGDALEVSKQAIALLNAGRPLPTFFATHHP